MTYIDLPVSGYAFQYKRIKILLNYFATPTDNYIGCDASNGNITVKLPPANTIDGGKFIIIKDEAGTCSDANKRIFISPANTDKIDGRTINFSVMASYESVTLVCNGVDEWFII